MPISIVTTAMVVKPGFFSSGRIADFGFTMRRMLSTSIAMPSRAGNLAGVSRHVQGPVAARFRQRRRSVSERWYVPTAMRQTSKTTLLAVTLAAMIGGADGSASQPPAGERAVDGELRTLTSLIGAWSGTAVEKDGATRRVELVFREQLDGRLIEGDYSSTYEHKPLRQVL